jgi:DNA-binding MarR family transcriptional regulator
VPPYYSAIAPTADQTLPPELAERLTEQVSELGRRLTAFRDEQTSALGLTVAQAQLLRILDAPLAMNQIASRLHCDASNITGIVDRLEARELVTRAVKPGDRRIKVIVLTAEGKRIRKKVAAMASSVPGLSRLTKSEQRALDDVLTKALG